MLHLQKGTQAGPACRAAPRRSYPIRRARQQVCRALDGSQEDARQDPTSSMEEASQALQQGPSSDSSTMLSSLSAAAKLGGRLGKTNVVLASDDSNDTWRKLDKKVNKYPGQRSFTAIGNNVDSPDTSLTFRASMVSAVERVVGSVHVECISERQSKSGTYVSVTVGPVWVENGDQVIAIYSGMRGDKRLRYFI